MTEPTDLQARLRQYADDWSRGRYGDMGLRLRAEATAAILRQAADALSTSQPPSLSTEGRDTGNPNR